MKNEPIITSRKYMPYTVKEDKMLRDGATMLPGRTQKAVYQRRRELGLVKPAKWTPDEIELAKHNIVPEGRTKAALRCLRNKLGITKNVSLTKTGQMELTLIPMSVHSTKHISEIVGKFARTVDILSKSGMTAKEIAEQTGKSMSTVQLAIDLAAALRIK
jgi:hypothetical protein